MTRYIATCPTCTTPTSASAARIATVGEPGVAAWDLVLDCRVCARPLPARLVRVGARSTHRCGERCQTSAGSECECECQGANHGLMFAVRVA